MVRAKWTYCKELRFASNEVCFSWRTSCKELIWCTKYSNVSCGFRGGHRGASRAPPPSFLFFPRKNIADKEKIHKRNINKIYQVEPTLKEMTCLMTIAETKKTFITFQFFHKYYKNNGLGKLIATVKTSNLKRSNFWKSITTLCALQIVAGRESSHWEVFLKNGISIFLVFLWCNYSMTVLVLYLRINKCCILRFFHYAQWKP